ncbi:hypothetical protein [Actinomadura sp. 21ATH]|uniref:hypothetical protein n=1 Tax=Actinomadura sp. 21ATH TaxID=1735444 RepID=UPI0035C052A4
MQRQPFRIAPQGPVGAYQTYQVGQRSDARVKTACEDAGCLAWRYGWRSEFDESTPLGAQQARYVRYGSGRTFREQRTGAGITVFSFEPGQRCFREHYTSPETYLVRRGDWRRSLGVLRQHVNAADFVEDFGEHQQRLVDQRERG